MVRIKCNKYVIKLEVIYLFTFYFGSSLLIVYEGYCDDDISFTNSMQSATTGYDADTSNSSADLNLSTRFEDHASGNKNFDMSTLHEEISIDEAPSKPPKVPFFPISEDTMYLEEPSNMHLGLPMQGSNMCSSPMSVDSWMVYSSNSSDDFCLSRRLDENTHSSEDTSSSEVDLDTSANLTSDFSKRPRVKTSDDCGPLKRKAVKKSQEASSEKAVDIRMIDFAHTTFDNMNAENTVVQERNFANILTNTTVHHGPDGGFLTGIDSLKRLLGEILSEA